jgi:hypothetical protein
LCTQKRTEATKQKTVLFAAGISCRQAKAKRKPKKTQVKQSKAKLASA